MSDSESTDCGACLRRSSPGSVATPQAPAGQRPRRSPRQTRRRVRSMPVRRRIVRQGFARRGRHSRARSDGRCGRCAAGSDWKHEDLNDNIPVYGNGLPGRAPDSGTDRPQPRNRARVRIERIVPPRAPLCGQADVVSSDAGGGRASAGAHLRPHASQVTARGETDALRAKQRQPAAALRAGEHVDLKDAPVET
jgi:hypothetical protein